MDQSIIPTDFIRAIFWGIIVISIIIWWTKKNKQYPKGSNEQKKASFIKQLFFAFIVFCFVVFLLGKMELGDNALLIFPLVSIAFIGYAIFMYNKAKIVTKKFIPMSQKKKEEAKETPKWEETKKAEPQEAKPKEVTITSQEEEEIYAQVAKELQENRNEGVWLKAYTENDGDEAKTKIAYTKKRVHELIEELKIKKQT